MKTAILGRRGGKSFGNGVSITQKLEHLSRGIGTYIAPTYSSFLSNTIQSLINAWERLGYYEKIHYVIGEKPPSWFEKPFAPPKKYDNIISFWCGHAVAMGSMDRPQLLRGGSRDYLITDEALLIDQEDYKQVALPTILTGSDIRLQGKPHHRNQEFTSTMPYGNTKGDWILGYEELAKKHPERYHYIEGTTFDNIAIIGAEAIKELRLDIGEVLFSIECLNKRNRRGGSLFYPALEDKHFYEPKYDYSHIDSLGFDRDKIASPDSRWDADCDTNLPIHISHDWGAFNTITVDQYHRDLNEVRYINHMWVKHPRVIDDLANDFCEYYKYHKKREVFQWGDKSGNKKEANAKKTYFEQFASILETKGWRVIKMKTGDIPHLNRHNFITKIHKEEDPNLPRITHNSEKCKDLRISLDDAGMKDTQKDKSSERSRTIAPEHATHSTDAYDYRLYHAFIDFDYQRSSNNQSSLGVHFGGH